MENGLEISSRKFEEIEKIHLTEFIDNDEKLLLICSDEEDDEKLRIIIWDLFDTDKVIEIQSVKNLTLTNLSTHLAGTSGNLFQVDDKGKVTSIIKMVEIELKNELNKINLENANLEKYKPRRELEPSSKIKSDKKNHTIYFYNKYDKNKFKPIFKETEPWVMDNYEKVSFYLRDDDIEALQLIVGRSTVQIWHKILSDPKDQSKKKENLSNEGKSFLEFIWSNGIPVNQENKENKLRIKKIKFGFEYFHLEVYWYEDDPNNEKEEMTVYKKREKMENMEEIKGMVIKEKTIKWNDINESVNGVRYACKALEHLNKRVKSLKSFINYNRSYNVS